MSLCKHGNSTLVCPHRHDGGIYDPKPNRRQRSSVFQRGGHVVSLERRTIALLSSVVMHGSPALAAEARLLLAEWRSAQ